MKFEDMQRLTTEEQKNIIDHIGKIRAKGKGTNYSCLPMETEVLTTNGWVTFSALSEGDTIFSYDTSSDEIVKDCVLKKHFFTDKCVFKYKNERYSFCCTEDHRWWGWKRCFKDNKRVKEFGFFTAKQITTEHNIILASKYNGGGHSQITPDESEFIGYLLSDGYFKWSELSEKTSASFGKRKEVRMSIAQSIDKYCEEIESCMNRLNVNYRTSIVEKDNGNHVKIFTIRPSWARPFLDRVFPGRLNKHDIDYTKWILSLSKDARESFYEAFYLGDGGMKNRHRSEVISQNEGKILDAVSLCMFFKGNIVTITDHTDKCKTIRSHKKRHITCERIVSESLGIQDTFCITTNCGTFIIRQGHNIMVTGNCQYGAGAATIARTAQVDLKVAKKLHAGYWKLNWSIKKIAEMMQVKTLPDGSMWQKNPINGFWYSLRTEKDRFSTLIQGLGSYILDIWLFNVFRLGKKYNLEIKLLGQFHKHHCGFVW